MAKVQLYKPSQGRYTRVLTFAVAVLVGAMGAYKLSGQLSMANTYVRYGVPAAALAGLAVLVLWLVNRPKTADFLIATEGEMKKVSWSSRKEIIGSTKVVIVTTFIMAGILFAVDIVFRLVFGWLFKSATPT